MPTAAEIIEKYTKELMDSQSESLGNLLTTTPAPFVSSTTAMTVSSSVASIVTTEQVNDIADRIKSEVGENNMGCNGEVLKSLIRNIGELTKVECDESGTTTGHATPPIVQILGEENTIIFVSVLAVACVGVLVVVSIIILLKGDKPICSLAKSLRQLMEVIYTPIVWLFGGSSAPPASARRPVVPPPRAGPMVDAEGDRILRGGYLTLLEEKMRAYDSQRRRELSLQAKGSTRSAPDLSDVESSEPSYATIDETGECSPYINQVGQNFCTMAAFLVLVVYLSDLKETFLVLLDFIFET